MLIGGFTDEEIKQMRGMAVFLLERFVQLDAETQDMLCKASVDLVGATMQKLREFERPEQIKLHHAGWVATGKFRTPAKDAALQRAHTALRKKEAAKPGSETRKRMSAAKLGNHFSTAVIAPQTLAIIGEMRAGAKPAEIRKKYGLSDSRVRNIREKYITIPDKLAAAAVEGAQKALEENAAAAATDASLDSGRECENASGSPLT